MNTRILRLFTVVAVTAACGGHAREPAVSAPPTADEAIQQAAWLAGHWRGEGLGGVNETLWSPPMGGTMMGVFRHLKDGRVVFYEMLTLAPLGDTLVLTLKHFDPDMTGWEERTGSVRFPLLRSEPDALHFRGMTYRRLGPDRREVTVMLGPDPDSLRPEVFTYHRVRS